MELRCTQFDVATESKPDLYRDVLSAIDAITAGEPDAVANMANAAAILWEYLPDLNWAGFYRTIGDELVLGPFQGKAACIRIPVGKGVCGAAAATRRDAIGRGCPRVSRPYRLRRRQPVRTGRADLAGGRVIAVIDLDSPTPARFDAEDAAGIEAIARMLSDRVNG